MVFNANPLRVLVLEDRPVDAELILHELKRSGYNYVSKRVDTQADYLQAIEEIPDIILADFSLPQFTAMQALHFSRSGALISLLWLLPAQPARKLPLTP